MTSPPSNTETTFGKLLGDVLEFVGMGGDPDLAKIETDLRAVLAAETKEPRYSLEEIRHRLERFPKEMRTYKVIRGYREQGYMQADRAGEWVRLAEVVDVLSALTRPQHPDSEEEQGEAIDDLAEKVLEKFSPTRAFFDMGRGLPTQPIHWPGIVGQVIYYADKLRSQHPDSETKEGEPDPGQLLRQAEEAVDAATRAVDAVEPHFGPGTIARLRQRLDLFATLPSEPEGERCGGSGEIRYPGHEALEARRQCKGCPDCETREGVQTNHE